MQILPFYKEKPRKSNLTYYILAILGGVVIFYVLLFGGKLLFKLIKFLIANWMWALAIVFGVLLLRRILFGKKRKREIQQ